ncbi:MAG: hypothetical protein AB7P14_06350 [Blastocatellales bacterium]
MSEKDIFAERERWLEEEYFRRKNQELIDKIHLQKEREAERQRLAEIIGVNNPDLLGALQELGYHENTIQLLHLVPLVQIAWAKDSVAGYERDRILRLAHIRGIEPGSESYDLLTQWLDEKPPERFIEDSLHALGILFESLPPEEREASRKNLIVYCTHVASSVGRRLLGLPELSAPERELLAHIADEVSNLHETVPVKSA